MKRARRICVFSGKRGGFGAYVPLMRLIEADPELELQILLADMHASKEFGETAQEARRLFPKARIELLEMGAGRGDSARIRAENLGTALNKAPAILEKLAPDVLMVHGDRGEHLVLALAALNLGIVVTHSQGGDISGNIDDIQRQAITKLAHIHFSETRQSAERIKKMGEEEWRIHIVGSLYIDHIAKKMYTPLSGVRSKYSLKPNEKYFIVITHPDTFQSKEENYQMAKAILEAAKSTGLKTFVVYPCSDPGYEGVLKSIDEIKDDKQFSVYKNIENLDFLGLMSGAEVLLGNSSSALVEAPYFKLPAINIGNRQMGRDREENVVDAEPTLEGIKEKINFVLTDKKFRGQLPKCGWRLGDGRAAEKILDVLKNLEINERLLRKRMTY